MQTLQTIENKNVQKNGFVNSFKAGNKAESTAAMFTSTKRIQRISNNHIHDGSL